MKVKIVINTVEVNDGKVSEEDRSEVWSGELDILRENVYLTKLSIIAEGEPQPICDIPFSLATGYWAWIPPNRDEPFSLFGSLVERDEKRSYD
jgi:hypothetical protein